MKECPATKQSPDHLKQEHTCKEQDRSAIFLHLFVFVCMQVIIYSLGDLGRPRPRSFIYDRLTKCPPIHAEQFPIMP